MVLSLSVRLSMAALLAASPLVSVAETVLLDFSSPVCGPCQEMRPVVQRLMADGLPVREIDITREPQLASRYGVTQVPTFLVVTDGRVVDQAVGPTSYRQLHRMLRRALPAPPPRQPVKPLGQSPGASRTFAEPAANGVAAGASAGVAGQYRPQQPNNDLAQSQADRAISWPETSARPLPAASPPPASISDAFGNSAHPAAPSADFGGLRRARPTAPAAGSPNSLHQRLLAATVKLSVEDSQGKSVGTGTIVDARSGEALILTCGHLFRSSAGQGLITVTTFQASGSGAIPGTVYSGKVIDYDLQRDLALVSMRTASPVQAVPIAGPNTNPLAANQSVTSVGCNHGQNATAIDSQVTSIDRYEGTPNVEVAGAPVEGRSGGGLFNAQGQLVGVCYAADPQANEGLYAALPAIYAKLDSLNLTMIYQPNAAPAQVAQGTPAPVPPLVAPTQLPTSVRGQEPEAPSLAASLPVTPRLAQLPPAEQAALEEIRRRGVNSEVICIIRPQDPNAKSEVITLNNASPAFLQALANPSQTGGGPAAQRAPASSGLFVR